MQKKHENFIELIWTLAKTDFTLRYHGSILGYLWAILKPLLLFTILNFVFSSIFNPRSIGSEFYSLQLLVGIVMFTFFSEGTIAGMSSLMTKAQLVTKIYVPRWTIIIASTVNTAMVYIVNLLVVVAFFIYKQHVPSMSAIAMFILSSVLMYILVVSFSLAAAPLYIKFRDLLMIWEVFLNALFYATPIIYPLTLMPEYIQRILLINPMGFLIHYTKESLFTNHFADPWQSVMFIAIVVVAFGAGVWIYRQLARTIAEQI